MAIDIPHIWLYLAQLLSPVLKEGGFSMRELFRYAHAQPHVRRLTQEARLNFMWLVFVCSQRAEENFASCGKSRDLNF